jgi:Tfp pilus assembly protein PilF
LVEKHSDGGGRSKSPSGSPTFVLTAASLVLAVGVVWTVWQARRNAEKSTSSQAQQPAALPRTPWKNAQSHVQYVGDAACARCHREIADTFRRHPMGRSLAPLDPLEAVGNDRSDSTTTFEAGSSRFTIVRSAGRLVHRETRLDETGQILAEVEGEVKYALGSGTRGISYLIEHDGRLFQSPISWYGQKKQWDHSPGYDVNDFHFDRAIEPNCLFCHANRALPVDHSVNRYEQPIFRGHAIGCERCHGPGELHARGQEVVAGRDLTIVNPHHLEPALRDAVCEQCHLLGEQRVDRLGRATFDYRPGLPLIEFFAVYGEVKQGENRVVGQVEQMKLSRCFRASDGQLGCISCHDPHQLPSPTEKAAYFRQQCLACHDPKGCNLPDSVRLARSRNDNCIQCHMPRTASVDIVHTATTDHRILRTPDARSTGPPRARTGLPLALLTGDEKSQVDVRSLGRELAIALALEGPRLPASPQVRQMEPLVLSLLENAVATQPGDLMARRMKAQVLALTGNRALALTVIDSVLRSAPADEKALDQAVKYAIDLGDIPSALTHARRAVAVNPYSATFHERLAHVLLERQEWSEARHEAREALRLNPFLRFARMFLVQCLLHQKDSKAANDEFATLIKLNSGLRESLGQWFEEQKRKYGSQQVAP